MMQSGEIQCMEPFVKLVLTEALKFNTSNVFSFLPHFLETRSERTTPEIPPLPSSKNPLQPPSPTHSKHLPQTTIPTNSSHNPRLLIEPSMLAMAKSALQPPAPSNASKVPLKPPPAPIVKSALKPPPVPPIKPQALSPSVDQLHTSNGFHNPPSPLIPEKAEANMWLEVGSMVEVNDPPLFGVIRWIGYIDGISEPVAGIELVRLWSLYFKLGTIGGQNSINVMYW